MGCVVATLMALAMGQLPQAEEPPLAEVVRGNTQFAADLYGRLRQRPGNLFFSPYSISTALAMTSAGAKGATAEQMTATLHLGPAGDDTHPAFAALAEALKADGDRGYRLSVANRLWAQQGYDFRPAFLAVTREHYGAELAAVDFAREAERARQRINAWVAEQTEGKIQDLIPPGVLDPLTRLVLTNAISFKGDWSEPFPTAATREGPFHVAADRQVQVPLMHRRGSYRYGEADGLKALELPYGEGDLAMVVLLPDAIDGLPGLEARLDAEHLDRWVADLRRQEVDVALPRFTLTSQFTLNEALKGLGMTLAFTAGEADFSGMDGSRELSLTAAIHKAFVDVNEEGTEAAAATGAVAATLAAPREPKAFRADHPFLFLIRHTRTGSILFLGRLTSPGG